MKKLTYILLICSFLNADNILNEFEQKNIILKQQNLNQSSKILKNSWINPLYLSVDVGKNKLHSKNPMQNYTNASLQINQDIFRSGGIFYAIDYANNTQKLGLLQILHEKNIKIINAYNLLYEILKNDEMYKKQELLLENETLDIKRKKEQYLAGLIDISYLNNAILNKIAMQNLLLDLEVKKDELLSEFKNLSDKNYKNIELKTLSLPTIEEFLNNNFLLHVSINDIKNKKISYNLTKSSYLPKISLKASYNLSHQNSNNINFDDNFYNVGLGFSMPFDIKKNDDIQNMQTKYLLSKNSYNIQKQNQINLYNKIIKNIKIIDKKMNLDKQNIQIYDSLLKQTKELVNAQIQIKDDETIMQNSKKIRSLDKRIHSLEKQQILLQLYKNYQIN